MVPDGTRMSIENGGLASDPESPDPMRFALCEDGGHSAGVLAHGVLFGYPNTHAVLGWRNAESVEVHDSIEAIEAIHGREGRVIEWLDDPGWPSAVVRSDDGEPTDTNDSNDFDDSDGSDESDGFDDSDVEKNDQKEVDR